MKTPAADPTRIARTAPTTNARLPAGPASAIHAARFGYRIAQRGSYGALANPNGHPDSTTEISGSTTMPNGSRRMCARGSRETWPP